MAYKGILMRHSLQRAVLVVDDDELTCKLTARAVEKAGFAGVYVESAEAAIEVLQSQLSQVFFGVVTDNNMGDSGMTGVDFVEWLRENGFSRPIILRSSDPDITWSKMPDGPFAHLQKSSSVMRVAETLLRFAEEDA